MGLKPRCVHRKPGGKLQQSQLGNKNRTMPIQAYTQEIAAHVTRHIGPIHTVFNEIESDELHIDVLHVKSSLFRRYEVLVTAGMSALPMAVPKRSDEPRYAEVLAILPKGWPLRLEDFLEERNYWPVRLLKDLARFPVRANTWLGYGHTVAKAEEAEKPLPYEGSPGYCGSVLLPSMTLEQESWMMERADGEQVCFWTAVPLYAAEMQLKRDKGVDALMDLMDEHHVTDRIDPSRPRMR